MALEASLQSPCAGTLPSTRPPAYARRRPEETVLYTVVREELETFLARAREREHPVPRFVEREFRAYLSCGMLERGFVRVRCDACGCDRLVAFSCKGRAFWAGRSPDRLRLLERGTVGGGARTRDLLSVHGRAGGPRSPRTTAALARRADSRGANPKESGRQIATGGRR